MKCCQSCNPFGWSLLCVDTDTVFGKGRPPKSLAALGGRTRLSSHVRTHTSHEKYPNTADRHVTKPLTNNTCTWDCMASSEIVLLGTNRRSTRGSNHERCAEPRSVTTVATCTHLLLPVCQESSDTLRTWTCTV
eukprot:4597344-Amphidinium_carterae.1